MSNLEHGFWHWIKAQELSDAAMQDLEPVLRTVDRGLMYLFEECLSELHVTDEEIITRVAPILLQQLAIHLADDLADDECNLFDNPIAQGTTALCSLQNLASLGVIHSPVNIQSKQRYYALLQKVGEGQHKEIRTNNWNIESSIEIARTINANLFSAYFLLAFDGTQIESRAETLGSDFGIANHINRDIHSADPRYIQLSQSEQQTLKLLALECIDRLLVQSLTSLKKYAQTLFSDFH